MVFSIINMVFSSPKLERASKFKLATLIIVTIGFVTAAGYHNQSLGQDTQDQSKQDVENKIVTRIWTDASGEFEVKAMLLEVKDDSAILKKESGAVITVPLSVLSSNDQKFIQTLLTKKKETVSPPATTTPTPPTTTTPTTTIPATLPYGLGVDVPDDIEKISAPDVAESEIELVPADLRQLALDLAVENDFALIRKRLKQIVNGDVKANNLTIIKLIAGHSLSKDKFSRQEAIKALTRLAPKAGLPFIAARLSDSSFDVRWETYVAIEKLGDPAFINYVVDSLGGEETSKVTALIKSFGPAAESAVHKHLVSKASSLRQSACDILAEVGTEKSISALKELSEKDQNGVVRLQARSSIAKIQKRIQR